MKTRSTSTSHGPSYLTSINLHFPKRKDKTSSTLPSDTSHHNTNNNITTTKSSSSTSNIYKNPLDGFAMKTHHMTISDYLYQSMHSFNNSNTNIIFNQPFPLINVISKRNILNNSPSLIRNILRCKRRKYHSRDQNLLLNKNPTRQAIIPEGYCNINLKRVRKNNENILSDKNEVNKYSLSYLKEIENKKKCNIKSYLHSHDCNVFNKTHFNKNPFDNYVRNAYKVKALYEEDYFMSKIKRDVCGLKYSNSLKVYPELSP
jgi:hypothetical protein